MGFLKKIFKREKKESGEKIRKAEEEVAAARDEKISEKAPGPGGKLVMGVLLAARITEKTSQLSKENKYVFEVDRRANKSGVKRAVEARYGVGVLSVNMVNIPGKERKRGKQIGWKPGYKKAVVKLKEGQTIEVQ